MEFLDSYNVLVCSSIIMYCGDVNYDYFVLLLRLFLQEQGDKIRRRNEWQKWVHSGGKVSPDLGSQAPGTSSDDNNLPTSIEKLSLDDDNSSKMVSTDKVDSETEVVADRHLPEESSFNPVLDNGELTAEELLHSSQ